MQQVQVNPCSARSREPVTGRCCSAGWSGGDTALQDHSTAFPGMSVPLRQEERGTARCCGWGTSSGSNTDTITTLLICHTGAPTSAEAMAEMGWMRHLHLMDEIDQVLQQSRKFCATPQAALEPQVIFHLSASPVRSALKGSFGQNSTQH